MDRKKKYIYDGTLQSELTQNTPMSNNVHNLNDFF